jgi:signal transduction histidine kinase
MALLDRTRRAGLEVEAELAVATDRLGGELETGVYRIVQEALTNAGKHGEAVSVRVRVIEDDGNVTITVRDDGRGFDPSAATTGFGLAGMRERVELLGGELSLTSAPDQGTTVAVTIPVHRSDVTEGAAAPPSARDQSSRPRSRA